MKVIQISSASSSFSVEDYEEDFFRAWYAKVGFGLKETDKNFDVECWTIEKEYKKESCLERNGVKFRIFPTNFSLRHGMEISLSILKAIKKEISKTGNSKIVLHFHEYHSWLVYSMLIFFGNSKKVKIIAQHHGGRSPFANLKKYKKLFLFFPVILLMQLCENLLFKRVNTFYVLSDEEKKYLKGISIKSKIKFQTMGISDEYFKDINKTKARRELKLKSNKKYGLYVGRIKKTKGIKELIDASGKLDDIEFLLIGGGTEKEVLEFKKYSKDNKIHNVKFLGQIFGDEKLKYLSAVDFLILPSYTEGAPVVLMEAMAKNLPIIATSVGGIPLMINDEKEGIIISPKSSSEIVEAVRKIINWGKRKIKKNAERYKWGKIIKNIMNDY